MKTSYFGRYKEKDGISIAIGSPRWFKGEKAKELMPTWTMVKKGYSKKEYIIFLKERGLSTKTIYSNYKDKVLLCWEKEKDITKGIKNCHRRYLAEWLEEELNVEIEEYSLKKIEKTQFVQALLF